MWTLSDDEAGRAERAEPTTNEPKRDETNDADVKQRGFASMDREQQRAIASRGGKAAHRKGSAHEFTREEAREAGKKGGHTVSRDRTHMAEIGRKGGQRVSRNREHMAAIGRKGGEAVSGDREHMAEIGRKGGSARTPE